mgnify:CR=1 FL=1
MAPQASTFAVASGRDGRWRASSGGQSQANGTAAAPRNVAPRVRRAARHRAAGLRGLLRGPARASGRAAVVVAGGRPGGAPIPPVFGTQPALWGGVEQVPLRPGPPTPPKPKAPETQWRPNLWANYDPDRTYRYS